MVALIIADFDSLKKRQTILFVSKEELLKERKIAVMSSWNTDGGVTRHITPICEWLIEKGNDIKVFSHYRETSHGYPLDLEDEEFVIRCYTYSGKDVPGLNPLDSTPLLRAIEEEGYNIFLVEDLGILPMEQLLKVYQRIRYKAKTVLVNHDNVPKPDDSLFWKFEWDAIVNFLPGQNRFMREHYPATKIYSIGFPTFPLNRGDRKSSFEKLGLPGDKNIILTFGEYNFVDFLPPLIEMRKKDPSIFLLALIYNEDRKERLEKDIRAIGLDRGYDEIRVVNSSWKVRRDYVFASRVIVLDKGKGLIGKGAIMSSTAFQVIGWGTPIVARDNRYFAPFKNDEVVRFNNSEELPDVIELLLYDDKKVEEIIKKADKLASKHSPEMISKQFIEMFDRL